MKDQANRGFLLDSPGRPIRFADFALAQTAPALPATLPRQPLCHPCRHSFARFSLPIRPVRIARTNSTAARTSPAMADPHSQANTGPARPPPPPPQPPIAAAPPSTSAAGGKDCSADRSARAQPAVASPSLGAQAKGRPADRGGAAAAEAQARPNSADDDSSASGDIEMTDVSAARVASGAPAAPAKLAAVAAGRGSPAPGAAGPAAAASASAVAAPPTATRKPKSLAVPSSSAGASASVGARASGSARPAGRKSAAAAEGEGEGAAGVRAKHRAERLLLTAVPYRAKPGRPDTFSALILAHPDVAAYETADKRLIASFRPEPSTPAYLALDALQAAARQRHPHSFADHCGSLDDAYEYLNAKAMGASRLAQRTAEPSRASSPAAAARCGSLMSLAFRCVSLLCAAAQA